MGDNTIVIRPGNGRGETVTSYIIELRHVCRTKEEADKLVQLLYSVIDLLTIRDTGGFEGISVKLCPSETAEEQSESQAEQTDSDQDI